MNDTDAIVIGSGSGGLTAALALARAGRRVEVFEQNHIPGGYSQSFRLDGFSFSPGVHYIGQLWPGGRLRRIYEGLGVADDLVFLELDPDGYDRVFVGNDRFDIPRGREAYRARLKERFPSEADGIDGYIDTMKLMADELATAAPRHGLREAVHIPARIPTVLRYGLYPLTHFLDRFTKEPFLRAILSAQVGDYGMAPSEAAALLHAGLQSYYVDGACYPRGGAHVIPETLIRHIRQNGGAVHLRTRVERIDVEGGRAVGVTLGDGTEVRADVVVSNADPGVTWGALVAPEHQSALLRQRIAHLKFSMSALSLFLAVDMDLGAAGLDSGNIWYSRTPDIDAIYRLAELDDLSQLDEVPGLFFNVTTLKDRSLRSDGLHTIEAITAASPKAFAKWRDSQPGRRGADYATLKERLTAKLIATIEQFVPSLGDRIVFRNLGTPLSNMHYVNASEGAIYGTEKTLRNLGPFSFPIETPLAGLYQCGASTLAPGINSVTNSGLAAAAAALGCEPDDLLTAKGQELRVYPADDPGSWPEELRSRD